MRVELIVVGESRACGRAAEVWREACRELGHELVVLESATARGRHHLDRLRLAALPALLVDGRAILVGVPTPSRARAALANAASEGDGGR